MITYNQEKYITQALESVLSQKVEFAFEVLVGDDASTDRTPKVIEEYHQRFPNIVFPVLRRENIGAARNAYELCKLAKGEYLAFCEGDDYWLSDDKLRIQVAFLDAHQDYIGCYHRCLVVDKDKKPLTFQLVRWIKYKKRFTFKDFKGGLYLPGQTSTIVKRNIFREMDHDFSMLYLFDKDISDRIANLVYLLEGDFGLVNLTLSAYRVDYDSKTSLTYTKFRNNEKKMLLDLEMTKFLEKYVLERNGKVIFTEKRCQILAKSVLLFLIHPNKTRFDIIKKVFNDPGTPCYSFLYIPVFVLKRLAQDCLFFIRN